MREFPQMAEYDDQTEALVREMLERVLASEQFLRSKRLSSLLRHLVETTLAGKKNRLGGYAIGIDVFDRDDNFNPETDAIVRVHAVRLRAALNHYYLTDGAHDRLVISIPKGSYVPEFLEINEPPSMAMIFSDIWKIIPHRWKSAIGTTLLVLILFSFALLLHSYSRNDQSLFPPTTGINTLIQR